MIIFYHNNYKITEVVSDDLGNFPQEKNQNIVAVLLDFAAKFEHEILIWCAESDKERLNVSAIPALLHHQKLLVSFNPFSNNYFDHHLGYIEDSPFIKINKDVKYGSWQMSSRVGAIHATVLNACKNDLKAEPNFDYFLNSFAKRAMVNGLLCYSEPSLLLDKKSVDKTPSATLVAFFKFTKQHYRIRWVFLLFFNMMLFEKKFPLVPFLLSFFYKRRTFNSKKLDQLLMESSKNQINEGTIDVLIPTIGRKEYLRNVLINLASQTHLPKNVIIIEQNPDAKSSSDLEYIQNQQWPFVIKHHFTHQSGACNARNIGLTLIASEFTFLADDDIVFENNLLENAIATFLSTGNEVFLVACHLQSQTIMEQSPKQFTVFGAGHAFVKSACFADLKFDMAYEFGFGEDNDFGMQLRNKGYDILYISTSRILHLKAPIGGFRTKPVLRWQNDEIQPKPSPTVMLFRLKYDTKEQLRNYKTTLLFKNININFLLNPYKYIKVFKQKWNRSIYWATQLKQHKL